MNIAGQRAMADPVLAEVIRTRLEAVGQEAGAAVEQTAISPIVTESKDYSVTICDANGNIVSANGVVAIHFGAAMNVVRCTIARYGDSVTAGDVFIANDPHNGGGLHPQDVVIHQPVFVDGKPRAWVALAAHMMDMGGMVPGSSAVMATECYQEALRLPSVRLVREGDEVSDVWDIIRNNIRGSSIVEMDMRSLVIGAAVAERKLSDLIREIGPQIFEAVTERLIFSAERAIRERVSQIEDGRYRSVAWVEYGESLYRVPIELIVSGDRLLFDLRDAPPQVPHFFNSKAYIIRAVVVPRIWQLLAADLPLNQAMYNVVELACTPGTLVDSVMPAPIAAAHMDAALPVCSAALQCVQMALHASPKAKAREFDAAPPLAAYGTGRWAYPGPNGERAVFTIVDGAFGGSPAGCDRDGIDLNPNLIPAGIGLELADIEVLETVYPILFHRRGSRIGAHGCGRFRSGAGCEEAFSPHDGATITGNMTGTKGWFPMTGTAGGLPGATTDFEVVHADATIERLKVQATGVTLRPGDTFVTRCASGGGYGDPLDRLLERVLADMDEGRVDRTTAESVYGVVVTDKGGIDGEATERRRVSLRRARLLEATPAASIQADVDAVADRPRLPLYPGVVQCGRYALAEQSGAVLAIAPGNWLDGCAVMETPLKSGAGRVVSRTYLDPATGRILYVSIDGPGQRNGIEVMPERWTSAV
jgi:N-methylhydantoinase B